MMYPLEGYDPKKPVDLQTVLDLQLAMVEMKPPLFWKAVDSVRLLI
jgi:hypothetical protein